MLVVALLSLSLLGCRQGGERADSLALTASAGTVDLPASSDPDVRSAVDALARGEPFRATRLLDAALRDSSRRTPAVVLLAAEAAAAWQGWSRVQALLQGAPWLDTLAGGRGRALLATAALERRADAEALPEAERAVAAAKSDRERAARLVVLARALDRLDRRDSAAAAYSTAAGALPEIADWLHLRAAGVLADSAARAREYDRVRLPVARARVAMTEALARERTGDFAGAARAYAAADEPAAALRARLSATGSDSAARAVIRRELLALAGRRPGSDDAALATEMLDKFFAPLSPTEELALARAAASAGRHARAITGFARAQNAGLLTAQDRYAYANALSGADRDRDAAGQYARITAPRALAAQAAYRRARALLRAGDGKAARTALARVATTWRAEPDAAAPALYLLGDLLVDDGDDPGARARFRELSQRYPGSSFAPIARFRSAIIAYANGEAAVAARALDTLVARYPSSEERNAATYWAGRAWARAGDSTAARARWRDVATREPASYYAMRAAVRLGEAPWTPAGGGALPSSGDVRTAMTRAALLERLGMDTEARFEYARLETDAADSTDRLLATAAAFESRDLAPRAIRLALRAVDRGASREASVYRLIYPVAHESTLVASATARGLDRALVAALIRQESSFNPRATSPAGARGLMQLMPSVGAQVARSLRYPVWDPVLLWQPDVNVELGTVHLAGLLKSGEPLERSLAAYNAGQSRVARWSRRAGVADPELFVERIPYDETRDYVRIVLRNREMYRGLYGW